MTRFYVRLIAILAILAVSAFSAWYFLTLPKSNIPLIHIAIVDSARIKTVAKAFVRVRELLEEQHKQAHEEILKQETELRKEYEQLKNTKVESSKVHQMKEEFDKKLAILEQTVQQKKERISKQFEKLSNDLESHLKDIIKRLAKKYDTKLVLNRYIQETQAILYNDSSLDITNEVIQLLDKELPNVKLPEVS